MLRDGTPLPQGPRHRENFRVLRPHERAQHEASELIRVFDQSFAANHLTTAFVDRLQTIAPLKQHVDFEKLKQQVPAFLTAAASFTVNHN